MSIKGVLAWGNKNPKKLFQLDGAGALLSAVLLGVVLVKWQAFFGIPKQTLYFLASLPCLFAAYDFFCYFQPIKRMGKLLRGVAIANLVYSCLSMALALYHTADITVWGWMYILSEMVIVGGLAFVELKMARTLMEEGV